MAICQFFLKGTCKFGTSCRNEHRTGGFGQTSSFAGLNKSSFQLTGGGQSRNNGWGKFQNNNDNQDSTEKIIQNIKQEMEVWKSSKMWPFSCFSYHKEKPCVTGLMDCSPEEVRLEAYKAKDSGNTSQYLNIVQQLQTQWMTRINELKSLTTSAWEQEQRQMNGGSGSSLFQSNSKTSGLFSSSSSLFSKQPESKPSGLFSSNSSGQSLFGQSSSQLFGQSTGQSSGQSIFGKASTFGTQASNPFGSPSQSTFGSQSVKPLFGQSSSPDTQGQGGIFSQTSSNQSIFGQQQAKQNSGGLFSQSANQNSGLFSQSTNQKSGGLFSQSTNQNTGLFSQSTNQNTGLFSSSANQSSGGLFSQSANQKSRLFSQQTASTAAGSSQGLFLNQPSQRLFGTSSTAQSNPFGQQQTSTAQQSSSSMLGNVNQSTATAQATSASATPANPVANPFLQAAMQQSLPSENTVPEIGSLLPVTEKDIAAFKADRFVFGQIPECPPPLELC